MKDLLLETFNSVSISDAKTSLLIGGLKVSSWKDTHSYDKDHNKHTYSYTDWDDGTSNECTDFKSDPYYGE